MRISPFSLSNHYSPKLHFGRVPFDTVKKLIGTGQPVVFYMPNIQPEGTITFTPTRTWLQEPFVKLEYDPKLVKSVAQRLLPPQEWVWINPQQAIECWQIGIPFDPTAPIDPTSKRQPTKTVFVQDEYVYGLDEITTDTIDPNSKERAKEA